MGRSLGVANSTADIDSGSITGVTTLGTPAGASMGFYGATPGTQRAAAIQAASVVSAASYISVSTNLSVFAAEVAATLTALGLWKGGA
jgi:predicted transporter